MLIEDFNMLILIGQSQTKQRSAIFYFHCSRTTAKMMREFMLIYYALSCSFALKPIETETIDVIELLFCLTPAHAVMLTIKQMLMLLNVTCVPFLHVQFKRSLAFTHVHLTVKLMFTLLC